MVYPPEMAHFQVHIYLNAAFLSILVLLNIMWFGLMLRVAFRSLQKGKVNDTQEQSYSTHSKND